MSRESVQKAAQSILRLAATAGPGMVVAGRVMRRLLEEGRPVSPQRIAGDLHLPMADVTRMLRKVGAEVDNDGNVLGLGLSLSPAPHGYHVHGRTFYAWCATDAIVFPSLFDHTASIDSPDPVDATKVRLSVSHKGVESVRPDSAVVSIMMDPAEGNAVRASVCAHGHFFASAETAAAWAVARQGATILSVDEAFQVGRILSQSLAFRPLVEG